MQLRIARLEKGPDPAEARIQAPQRQHEAAAEERLGQIAPPENRAALCVKDSEAHDKLLDLAIDLVYDRTRLDELSRNIRRLALPDSARIIAQEVLKLIDNPKEEKA